MTALPEFRVTFGVEPHGKFPEARPDSWVTILAPTEQAARLIALERLGTQWCDIYSPEAVAEMPWGTYFPGRELARWTTEGAKTMDLIKHLDRQREFSARTFGPGERRDGVLDHIAKEIEEVREAGALEEWVDLILLALDGAWRSGATSQEIADAIEAKQAKNENRSWPDWRTAEPGKAIEHHRDGTPGCGYCGRDNDNGTHDALVSTGHISHDYDPGAAPGPEVSG
jgi:Protein of unknown function (DUF550)